MTNFSLSSYLKPNCNQYNQFFLQALETKFSVAVFFNLLFKIEIEVHCQLPLRFQLKIGFELDSSLVQSPPKQMLKLGARPYMKGPET